MTLLRRRIAYRLRTLSLMAFLPFLAVPVAVAQPAPPSVQTAQAPGFYRMALGEAVVTALYDGYVTLDSKLLKGASAHDIQSLLAQMFVATTPGMQTAVNGFLIHTGGNLILVDTGAGACFGPGLGGLAANIQAAGYQPDQIDTVLLTHLHPDHVCGLLSADGSALFNKAEVYASIKETNFWLNPEIAAKAPPGTQGTFEMARAALAPYQEKQRFHSYTTDDELPDGISIVSTPGHTPGHTSYLFESAQQSLLVWGDIVHSHATQFARPEIAMEFDVDQKQAIATRRKLFQDAARDKLWIAAAHMPFPGLGHVRKTRDGYAWVPVEYGPLPSQGQAAH